ncbi:hypothetical protein [Burkholderia contaminans]|uniref:FUSC family protein n=1 Tax=Burkholderia contaminans TaxID=488447 RepID=A0ABD7YF43_9BURK|nr:hypothetical protein [Burkholderia contaminans]WFN23647.1 hypothetical protein LXE91_39620 [Burkholderia contaminans]
MQLPKTAKNRNLETVRIRVLPPVLLAPLRRPSPAPLRRPATLGIWLVFNLICVVAGLHPSRSFHALVVAQLTVAFVANAYDVRIFQSVRAFAAIVAAGVAAALIAELIVTL